MRPQPKSAILFGLAIVAAAGGFATPDPFASCEERFARSPEAWESSRCFYEVGRSANLWREAAGRLEGLAGRRPDHPWPLLARAYVEGELDAKRASGMYGKAIAAFRAAAHVEGEVRARSAFASWLSARGNQEEAEAQLAGAVRSAEEAKAREPLAEALVFQARHRQALGVGLQEAYRLARRAEGILFPTGDRLRQMLCLELLGKLERALGRPERAEGHFRRLAALAAQSERPGFEARAQFGLGILLLDELDRAPRQARREATEAQLRKALVTAEKIGDPELEAATRANLAPLLRGGERRGNLERCLELARDRYDPISSSCLLALVRLESGEDPAAAERAMAEAGRIAERSSDPFSLARFWYDRMNLSWSSERKERATADTREAILAVEALRDRQVEQMGRAGLFSRWLAPYYSASGRYLTAYQSSGDPAALDQAFAIAEALRARVLRELLAPSPRLAVTASPAIRREVERALAPGEALLTFQIAPREDLFGFAGGSWLLAVTRKGTRVYPLPEEVERGRLETAVSALLGLVEKRDGSEIEVATALGSRLLAPALADLPSKVNRLVIVPDGALHLLPFADLRTGTRAQRLAERYQISMASSATLWSRWRQQGPARPRAALILADPSLPSPALSSSGPRTQRGEIAKEPLPGARREGRRVLRRLGGGSVLRIGAEAGEDFLKQSDLSRFALLHFATHAEADEAEPEASAVLLAAGRSGEDGRLQVDEIARLHLPGTLVVLSSCRGAAGALVGGEGLMSLSRAFFAAGASVVLASLWPVRDDEAEEFFAAFYDHLSAGETAATAFGVAQRERIHSGAPAEAWAGFVLSGNGGWRLPRALEERPPTSGPVRRGGESLELAALAGIAALGLAAFYFRRRSRRALGTRSRGSRTEN